MNAFNYFNEHEIECHVFEAETLFDSRCGRFKMKSQ